MPPDTLQQIRKVAQVRVPWLDANLGLTPTTLHTQALKAGPEPEARAVE